MADGQLEFQIQDLKKQLIGVFQTLGTFLADLKAQVGSVKETVEVLQSRGVSTTPSGAQISREEYQQSIQLIAQHLRTLAGEVGELKAYAGGSRDEDSLTTRLDALAHTPAEVERVVRETLTRFGQQLEASSVEDGQFYEQLRGRLDQFDASLRDLPQQVLKAPQWISLDELPAIAAGLEELRAAVREQLARPVADPDQLDALVARVDDLQTSASHVVEALRETQGAVTSSFQAQRDQQEQHAQRLEECILAARPADLRGDLEALPERFAALLPSAEQTPAWGQRILEETESVRTLLAEYAELAKGTDATSEFEQLLEKVDQRLEQATQSWREELARLSLPASVAPPDIEATSTAPAGAASSSELHELNVRLDSVMQQVAAMATSLDSRLSALAISAPSPGSGAGLDLAPIREQLAGIEAAVRLRDEADTPGSGLPAELRDMEARLEQAMAQLRDSLHSENERSAAILETLAERPAPEPPAVTVPMVVDQRLQALEDGIAAVATRLDQLTPPDATSSFAAAAASLGETLTQQLEQRLNTLEEALRTMQPPVEPPDARLKALEARLEALDHRLSSLQVPDATPAIQALAASLENRFQQLESALRRPVVVPPAPLSRSQQAPPVVPAEPAPASGAVPAADGPKVQVPPREAAPKPAESDGEDVNRLLLEALGLEPQ